MKHVIDLVGNCMPVEWKKAGWTIEEHIGEGSMELDYSKIGFHLSPNQISKLMKGFELRKELKNNKVPVLNACWLEYFLAHPKNIPQEWKCDKSRNPRFIFFWGTIYCSPDGMLCVRYLCWHGDAWCSRYYWLADDWSDHLPAAVLVSVTQP